MALHLLEVVAALWLLLGGGHEGLNSWIGERPAAGDHSRRVVLAIFAVVLFVRLTLTGLYLLRRRFGWSEAFSVALASGMYQLGFAWLGAGAAAPLGLVDALGIALFAIGSAVNTGSELQRHAFKSRPQHAGKIYTGGLFSLCRHPNYFGDCLWGIGWAVLTRDPWSAALVAIEVAGFAFSQIPLLDRYLESHYGDDYRAWAKRTKSFIPFLY